jgi:hypothetical protein
VEQYKSEFPEDYKLLRESVMTLMDDYKKRCVITEDSELGFVRTIEDLKKVISSQLKEKLELVRLKY